jgi:hypothetical protein
MSKYSCEKCAKTFSQKSHYDKHLTRKNPCEIQTDKIKALIDKAVEEKLIELNKKLILNNTILNNTENNITVNMTEQMDISKTNTDSIKIDSSHPVNTTPTQMTITAEAVREAGLDKFYTIPSISEKCLASIGSCYKWSDWGLVIEPSAGNGSFLTRIPTSKRLGIDISPEHEDIIKQDFLTYSPPSNIGKILVVGNPPFGRVSSLAIKFFNHASKWADVIAFIIPRTFRRVSVHNKLNTNFHLVFDEEIPMEPCSFSPPMMVKCCFQIWEKQETKRNIIELSTSHEDWEFLGFGPKDTKGQPTPPKGADFAMRAYGGKCGEIVDTGLETLRPKSWHWIKTKINKNTLIERFTALDYTLSLDTARQNSMGKGELVRLYSDAYD